MSVVESFHCNIRLTHHVIFIHSFYLFHYQVRLKETDRIYAMKVIKKELVNDDEDIDWVQTEKHVFEIASNHPFLVGLHSCFQTRSRYVLQSSSFSEVLLLQFSILYTVSVVFYDM